MKEPAGYIIWGVDDVTHQIIGTSFRPHKEKVGNEELESWLSHHLFPRVDFKVHEVQVEGKPVVVFEVPAKRDSSISHRALVMKGTTRSLRASSPIQSNRGQIKLFDPESSSKKHASYVPIWA